MATRFAPLRLPDPEVFGVRVHGAFGRGDRQRILDLGRRCLDRGKLRLLLDCEDLDSLGGSGAAALAELQEELVERGGEVVFAAAGTVVRRFLSQKFGELPLRCYETLEDAMSGLGSDHSPAEEPAADPEPEVAARDDLDEMLHDYEGDASELDADSRRTADLVTAAYVSLDDVLAAVRAGDNPTALDEALGILLDAHDLAAESTVCVRAGDRLTSPDSTWSVPATGGIAETLLRVRRPLTLIDVQDGELWDEEGQFLEQMQPDLILPLIRHDRLEGVVCLKHAGDDHDYGLAEVFALEMLQRLLTQAGEETNISSVSAGEITSTASGQRVVTLPDVDGAEVVLGAKLDLARGLQDAQDGPHFWQVFIARLRLAATVTGLYFHDLEDEAAGCFAAGTARLGPTPLGAADERLRAFFKVLERPVEIANMPNSFAPLRDRLSELGLSWLVALRDEERCFGVLALGLEWHGRSADPVDEIHAIAEITAEAWQRLREDQRWSNLNLGLLESLLVDMAPGEPDEVTRAVVEAVRRLSRELGLSPGQERDLVLSALVRDIGLDASLVGAGDGDQLTGEQWERYRAHPELGDQALARFDAPAAVGQAIRHHHERFDGRGFPQGLSGREIPLVARVLAVAEVHARTLVTADEEAACESVRAASGKSLDPDLTEIFLKAVSREGAVATDAEPVSA